MIEQTLLWGISALGEAQLKTLAGLLAAERSANPQVQPYAAISAGPAAEAERPAR